MTGVPTSARPGRRLERSSAAAVTARPRSQCSVASPASSMASASSAAKRETTSWPSRGVAVSSSGFTRFRLPLGCVALCICFKWRGVSLLLERHDRASRLIPGLQPGYLASN